MPRPLLEFPLEASQPCEGEGSYYAWVYYSTSKLDADRSTQIYLGAGYDGYEDVNEALRLGGGNMRKLAAMAIMRLCNGEAHDVVGPRLETVENVVFTMPNPSLIPIRPPDPAVVFDRDIGRARQPVPEDADQPLPPALEPVVFLPYTFDVRQAHPALYAVEANPDRFDHCIYVALRGLEKIVETPGAL